MLILMGKARYFGLGRNQTRTRTRGELMCVVHNIKRGGYRGVHRFLIHDTYFTIC